MNNVKRKTAGEMSLKAASDTSLYDPLEVAHALTDDMATQLQICAETHAKIFDMDEFCLILVIASDPLIQGVRRHKYTAFPFLPKPRPQQTVFTYNKRNGNCKRLWCLPNAKTMAIISEMPTVSEAWKATKYWCDSFFKHTFFDDIRKMHGIDMMTESEYLNAHRAEFVKAGADELEGLHSDPFDFSKVTVKQVVDKYEPIL